MFASYLVRIYAWRTILGSRGLVNSTLDGTDLTSAVVVDADGEAIAGESFRYDVLPEPRPVITGRGAREMLNSNQAGE